MGRLSTVVAVGVRGVRAGAADEEVHAAEVAQVHAVTEHLEDSGIGLGQPGRYRGPVLAGLVVQGSQRPLPGSLAVTLSRCSMGVPQPAQSGQSGGWVHPG